MQQVVRSVILPRLTRSGVSSVAVASAGYSGARRWMSSTTKESDPAAQSTSDSKAEAANKASKPASAGPIGAGLASQLLQKQFGAEIADAQKQAAEQEQEQEQQQQPQQQGEQQQQTHDDASDPSQQQQQQPRSRKYRPMPKSTVSMMDPGKKKALKIMGWLTGAAVVGGVAALGMNFPDEKPGDFPPGFEGYKKRWLERATFVRDYFQEPAPGALLPYVPPEHSMKYTLVLNLDEMLINSVWDKDHGWRIALRPGIEYFLLYLSNFYELVLFTSQPDYVARPIAEKLDKFGIIPHKLFRESTTFRDGKRIKDLARLNRDLSKVIIMDSNPESYSWHPDNAIAAKPWKGDANDTFMTDILPFLETVALREISDVRPLLKFYHGKDIPTAFARFEDEEREQYQATLDLEEKKRSSGLAGWLGIGQHQHEQQEQQLQLQFGGDSELVKLPLYQRERKYIRKNFDAEYEDHKKKLLRRRQIEMEVQDKLLKEEKISLLSMMTLGAEKQREIQLKMEKGIMDALLSEKLVTQQQYDMAMVELAKM
ncbi:HAD-like protein [Ramicandelaber brevisporus]|nr:HAD-like protein [Ramicandelaber brevisporus]